jgi:hypothetical protein
MKYINSIKYLPVVAALTLGMSSCDDFLDRPTEDSYNVDNFYQTEDQCYQGVNYLYNSPWYDFQRGFIKVGEVMSGNMYWGSSPYLTLTTNGTDEDLINMSYSLWAVIGHANTVYNNLEKASAPEEARRICQGECLTWKALAYFYLVRTFGEVPIIHNNTEVLSSGTYNDQYKVKRADVYEYIIMTLEAAMDRLPKTAKTAGRLDYYCAEALLAKVYLTKSGLNMSGSRSSEDLAKAAAYAKDVIDNSGRHLLANYSDVFRLANNESEESLIAWRWYASREPWTQQNTLQSDLAMQGFDENGDCWGGWGGPSVDLQDAFGVSSLDNPATRADADTRRKATMMLAGDVYDYFWTDKGGFDVLRFVYDSEDYGKGGPGGVWQCPTGAYNVKHLYGDNYDHEQALGITPQNMSNGLATHILRLSDVYLIYAEAVLGNAESTSDASALAAFNAVRSRAIPTANPKTSITFDDVWKERRLELAGEGDRWYDFVRLSYYNVDRAISELTSQRRNAYDGYDTLAKAYYDSNYQDWTVDPTVTKYNTDTAAPTVTADSFTLPFPTEDLVYNKHLSEPAIDVDVRATYSY